MPLIASCIIVFICLTQISQTYRILGIFPHPAKSHHNLFSSILENLANRGHEVTVISSFRRTQYLLHYKDFPLYDVQLLTESLNLEQTFTPSIFNVYKDFAGLAQIANATCTNLLFSSAIDKVLKIHDKERFDILLMELLNTDCVLGLAYKMNLSSATIGISPCALMPWFNDRYGIPEIPSFIPYEYSTFSERMNFWERFENFLIGKYMKILYRQIQKNDNELLQSKFDHNIPDVAELAKEATLAFVNQNFILSGIKPLPPNVIEIGGVHLKELKKLPKSLKMFLDHADSGLIYINWGSVTRSSSMAEDKRISILNALKRFPHKVLWKWEEDEMPNKTENIFIKKWLPQRDVLCHHNVKVFLSHGGQLGLHEAIDCGVPLVITPQNGDQYLNAAAAANREIAVILNYEKITEITVYTAITAALHSRMKERMNKFSNSFKSRPMSPLDTAMWWIEHYPFGNGTENIKPYSVNLNWFSYYSLDIISVLIALMILCICCLIIFGKIGRLFLKICWKYKFNKIKTE